MRNEDSVFKDDKLDDLITELRTMNKLKSMGLLFKYFGVKYWDDAIYETEFRLYDVMRNKED